MSTFEVTFQTVDQVPVISVSGYFERPASVKFQEAVEQLVAARKVFIVLDLAKCKVLASPGVSMVVEQALNLNEQHKGRLILCGLDAIKQNVFRVVCVHAFAEVVDTQKEAVELARRLPGSGE